MMTFKEWLFEIVENPNTKVIFWYGFLCCILAMLAAFDNDIVIWQFAIIAAIICEVVLFIDVVRGDKDD